MSSTITRPCPNCRRTQVGRLNVARGGRDLIDEWPRCICSRGAQPLQVEPEATTYDERAAAARKTGICMDCDQPVGGQVGFALRCRLHKLKVKAESSTAWQKSPAGLAKAREKDRRRRKSAQQRARRQARRRQLHAERMANDPEYAAAYRKRRQRETLHSYPGRAKLLETQRRHNADPERAQKKRDYALEKYYELHPTRPAVPDCVTCGRSIEWRPGRGRTPKYHQTAECNPHFKACRAA